LQIKARLQRKDNSGRSGQTTAQRFSPVPILTNSLSPRASASQPIKIPVPIHENGMLRGTPGKARASVEGLNPVCITCALTVVMSISFLLMGSFTLKCSSGKL